MNFKVTYILVTLFTLLPGISFCSASKKKVIDKNTDLIMVAQELLQKYHSPLEQDSLIEYIPQWLSEYQGSDEYKNILSDLVTAENYLLYPDKAHLSKALSYYNKAWPMIEKSDLTLSKASVKHQIGNTLYRMEEYVKGLEYLLRADWLMHHNGYEKFANLGTYLYNLGYAYAYYFEDFENGKYYLDQAVNHNFANPVYRYASYDFLGLLYRQNGNMDSSHKYFQMALREAIRHGDSVSYGEITGNIGFNYYLEKNYEEANRLLQINHQFAIRYKNWTSAALSLVILTKMDIQKGNMTEATEKLSAARRWIDSIRTTGTSKAVFVASYSMYENYLALAKWQKAKDLIIGIQDTILMYKDSLNSTRDIKTALQVQINLIKESSETQIQLLKSEEIKKVWIRNFIILVCFILSLVLGLYIYQLRMRNRRDQQKIAEYLNKITEKNRLLIDFQDRIEKEKSKNQLNTSANDLSQNLQFLRSATMHTEDDWIKFKTIFEKVYPGFFNEISKKIPNVSPTELRFLALTKLGVPSRQIAQSLGIAVDSVRKLRYRLRKKIEHNLKAINEDLLNLNIL